MTQKTTQEQKEIIARMRSNGASISLICKATGIRSKRIALYWLQKLGFTERIDRALTEEQVKAIRESNDTILEDSKKYGVCTTVIFKAKHGRTYKWVK